MGIQLKSGAIYGKVGSVIYRRWRGLNLVQGRPQKMKQSIATRAAAAEFGLASATSANIRKSLSLFYKVADKTMGTRLNREVLRAFQACRTKDRLERDFHDADLSLLKGFEFNEAAPLAEVLPVSPQLTLDNKGFAQVSVPAFRVSEIRHGGEISNVWRYRLRIVALAYNFREEYVDVLAVQDQKITNEGLAIDWKLTQKPASGSILLIGMALYAEQGRNEDRLLLNGANWSPACILGMTHIEETTSLMIEANEGEEKEAIQLTDRKISDKTKKSNTNINTSNTQRFSLPHTSGKKYCKNLVQEYQASLCNGQKLHNKNTLVSDICQGRFSFQN